MAQPPQWGKFKEKLEPQPEQEQPPEQPEQEGQVPVDSEGNPLSEEQVKAIQIYFAWKEALSEYEKPELYRMLMDVLSELIALETYDLDDRIDFLIESINETRKKIGLPEVEEPDYDYEDDEEDEEDEDEEEEEDERQE